MGELEGNQVLNGSWKSLFKNLVNIKGAQKTIILVKYDSTEVHQLWEEKKHVK